jgi:glycosyltransferase involved in cell wall biosynthesis
MSGQRIALVYDAVYPFSIGGGERRFHEIAVRLAERGHEVHLYGMTYWDGPDVLERDGVVLHGLCRARPLYTADGRRSITQALVFGLASIKMLLARFDVIDCCGFPYFSLFACKLAAVLRRRPLHATWHEVWGREYWTTYLGRLGPVGYAVERLAARLPDHVIAVSQTTADRLRNDLGYRGKLTVVPNGVDVEAIGTAPPAPDAPEVVYAGRLMDFKNVDLLVRAVALLRDRGRAVRCVIVGDGPERERLEQLTIEETLTGHVTFAGFVEDSADVYRIMRGARVFVLPSAREGFGISVVEANAAGLPVVTVDLPDNLARHLVTDGENGLVVAATPQAVADAVATLLDAPPPAERCRTAAAGYDWSNVADAAERALMSMTRGGPR